MVENTGNGTIKEDYYDDCHERSRITNVFDCILKNQEDRDITASELNGKMDRFCGLNDYKTLESIERIIPLRYVFLLPPRQAVVVYAAYSVLLSADQKSLASFERVESYLDINPQQAKGNWDGTREESELNYDMIQKDFLDTYLNMYTITKPFRVLLNLPTNPPKQAKKKTEDVMKHYSNMLRAAKQVRKVLGEMDAWSLASTPGNILMKTRELLVEHGYYIALQYVRHVYKASGLLRHELERPDPTWVNLEKIREITATFFSFDRIISEAERHKKEVTVARPLQGPDPFGIRTCTRCSHAQSRKAVIIGRGNPSAPVFVIGLAPSIAESKEGEAFKGFRVSTIEKMLKYSGLNVKKDVFFTHVIKCRPGNGSPLDGTSLPACGKYLDQQLAAAKPKLVITVGEGATSWYMRKIGLSGNNLKGFQEQEHFLPLPSTEEIFWSFSRLKGRINRWLKEAIASMTDDAGAAAKGKKGKAKAGAKKKKHQADDDDDEDDDFDDDDE